MTPVSHFDRPSPSENRGLSPIVPAVVCPLLSRQYLPKGTCMKSVTQKQCDWIAHELNTRPRKRHGYKTPLEIYHAS